MAAERWFVRESTRAKITDWSAAVVNGRAAFDIDVITLDEPVLAPGNLRTQAWAHAGQRVEPWRLADALASQSSRAVPAEPDPLLGGPHATLENRVRALEAYLNVSTGRIDGGTAALT